MDAPANAAPPMHPALLLGLLLGTVAYVGAHLSKAYVLTYLPVTGVWTWHAPEGVIAMHYYGVVLWGLAGFVGGAAVGSVPLVRRFLAKVAIGPVAIATLLLAVVYFVVREASRAGL